MWLEHGAGIFRVELRTDIPFVVRYFHDFDEVGFGVCSDALHAGVFVGSAEVAVELIAMTMTFADDFGLIDFSHLAARFQFAFVASEAHGAAHVGDVLLVFHQVDDVERRGRIQFHGVGVVETEHVSAELNHHHLHAEANAEGRDVLLATIACSNNLSFRAALSEARTDDETVIYLQRLRHVFRREFFAVDEVALDLQVVVGAGLGECFQNALIGILKVIFSDQTDVHFFRGFVATVEEGAPGTESRSFSDGHVKFAENRGVESLLLHSQGHFIDGRHVQALHNGIGGDVAEVGNLSAKSGVQIVFGAKHQDVRLNTNALEFFHRVLRRLRLQFSGGGEVGDVGQMHADRLLSQFPFQLSDGFQERLAFNVADGAADFCDDEIIFVLLAQIEHVAFDFIGDVRDDLNGFSEIVPSALFVDDALVDTPRGEVVVLRRFDSREAFVVSEVEVSFLSVVGDVAFPVFVGV